MDCKQAQFEMNERLDQPRDNKPADWSALDAHLSGCPKCAKEWLELLRTKQLLANLRDDKPTPEELDTMWQAIATTAPFDAATIAPRFERGAVWRFVASTSAIAACLFIALLLGREKYAEFRRADAARAVAQSGLTYASDDKLGIGRMLPSHDSSTAMLGYGSIETKNADAFQAGTAVVGAIETESRRAGLSTQQLARGVERTKARGDETTVEDHIKLSSDSVSFGYQAGYDPFTYATMATPTLIDSDYDFDDSLYAGRGIALEWSESAGDLGGRYADQWHFSDADKAGLTTEGTQLRAGDFVLGVPLQTPAGIDAVGQSPAPLPDEELAIAGNYLARAETPETAANAGVEVLHGDGYAAWGMGTLSPEGLSSNSDSRLGDDVLAYALVPKEPPVLGTALMAVGANEPAEAPVERVPSAPPPPPAGTSASQSLPPSVKIIKTGELAVEVAEYAPAAVRVEAIIAEHGAFIADARTSEDPGGALDGTFVIRVTPQRFDALFAALKQIGKLESESAKAADVTAQYVDIEARIKSLRITEERLHELIKTKSFIDRVSSLLEVEKEMTRVRIEIEQYEGQLRVMANRVALSTITIRLHEPGRIVPGAFLSVEVPDLDSAVESLRTALESIDARIASGKIEKKDNGSLSSKHELRVALSHYGEALDAISHLGRVTHRDIRDWQPADADKPWAPKVRCIITLAIREIEYQLPKGEITIEVENVDAAVTNLESAWAEAGVVLGSNTITRREDGSSTAAVELRVPAGAFAAVADRIGDVGRTLSKKTSGSTETITGGAAKQLCRLALTLSEPPRQVTSGKMLIEVEAFETGRAALDSLVSSESIQVLDASSIQRSDGTWMGAFRLGIPSDRIDKVVAGLEGLGRVVGRELRGVGLGELARTNPDALGVIHLTLGEKAALSPGPDRSRDSIRGRVREGLAGLYASLGMIAYGLVVMAPWIVLVIVAGWLITRFWRRRSKSKNDKGQKSKV